MELLPEEKEIISEFEIFDNWMEKYEYLIELGKDLPIIDASHKNDKNLIKGCQSRVWLHAEYNEEKVAYYRQRSNYYKGNYCFTYKSIEPSIKEYYQCPT